jgi:hypothetical protein
MTITKQVKQALTFFVPYLFKNLVTLIVQSFQGKIIRFNLVIPITSFLMVKCSLRIAWPPNRIHNRNLSAQNGAEWPWKVDTA